MAKNSKKTNTSVKQQTIMEAEFAKTMGGETSGVAVMVKVNQVQGTSPAVQSLVEMIENELTSVALEVLALHESAKIDLEMMAYYQAIIDKWNAVENELKDAKVSYDLAVGPMVKQLEDDRKDACSTPTWVTFEKSEEISKMIKKLIDPKAYEKFVPQITAKREALLSDYNGAQEFLHLNAQRKNARRASVVK